MAHFLIYRSPRCGDQPPGGFTEQLTKDQARTAFKLAVHRADVSPRNGRRVLIAGPDYCIQPEDFTDPLVTGEEGVKRALSPEEWQAYVGLTVAAVLES
jgi:hypothetical protein